MNSGPYGKEEVLAEQGAGTFMLRLAEELFPICRSITELSGRRLPQRSTRAGIVERYMIGTVFT